MEKIDDLEEARSDLLNARAILARHNLSELELRADTLIRGVEVELARIRDPETPEEATVAP